jgi:urease accessory protein
MAPAFPDARGAIRDPEQMHLPLDPGSHSASLHPSGEVVPMIRAVSVVRKLAVKPQRVSDSVTLDHEHRHRRRIRLTSDGDLEFLLDLDKAAGLDDGDALKLEDGQLILVKAAPQRLIEIKAENPLRLLRIAWHIGNRHTPAEITADAIYIEEDHVLAEMVRGQGCSVTPVTRPFRPERGAYDHDHAHSHPSGE